MKTSRSWSAWRRWPADRGKRWHHTSLAVPHNGAVPALLAGITILG